MAGPAQEPTEHWYDTPSRPVRSLVTGTARAGVPELVLVPGLGALGYLLPTARVCARWTRVHVLDVPGFGHRSTARLPADLDAAAGAVTGWLDRVPTVPVLLLGHSTGAQIALHAALRRPAAVALLALGGAVFDPAARRPGVLVRRVLATLPHERPGELPAGLPQYLRGARGLPALLRTALADRPEDVVGQVRAPVLVLRGEHDALCPVGWAQLLAGAARHGRALQLPGAHNVPYTHPEVLSAVLQEAVLPTEAPR